MQITATVPIIHQIDQALARMLTTTIVTIPIHVARQLILDILGLAREASRFGLSCHHQKSGV